MSNELTFDRSKLPTLTGGNPELVREMDSLRTLLFQGVFQSINKLSGIVGFDKSRFLAVCQSKTNLNEIHINYEMGKMYLYDLELDIDKVQGRELQEAVVFASASAPLLVLTDAETIREVYSDNGPFLLDNCRVAINRAKNSRQTMSPQYQRAWEQVQNPNSRESFFDEARRQLWIGPTAPDIPGHVYQRIMREDAPQFNGAVLFYWQLVRITK